MYKLLLADDSVTIQRVIELTFSGEDIHVTAVSDGEQAIASILADQPDIVLADIGMPKQSGYDVAAFIKGRPDLSHIPVLLLAGAFERVDEGRAEQVKCDGVLVKPFEPRQVVSRVRELVTAPRSIAPPVPATLVVPEPVDVAPVEELHAPEPPPAVEDPPAPAELFVEPSAPTEPPASAAPSSSSFLDESLDEYFERLNAAFSDIQKPAQPADRSSEGAARGARGDSMDGYFDRLSAAFADLAKPQRPVNQMPTSFDELTTDLSVPTVDALIEEGHESGRQNLAGPPTALRTSPVLDAPTVEGHSYESSSLEVQSHEPSPHGSSEAQQEPAATEERLGGIADVLTALLAERDESSESHEPAGSLEARVSEPIDIDALAQDITNRVLDRLAPEVAVRLRQLVLDEIEKVSIR